MPRASGSGTTWTGQVPPWRWRTVVASSEASGVASRRGRLRQKCSRRPPCCMSTARACARARERESVCVCARVCACAPSALEPGNQRTSRPGVQSQKPWPVSTVSCRVCAAPPVARTRGLWHVCGRHMPCQPAKPGRMQLQSHTHPRPLAFRRTPHGAPVPQEPSASDVSMEAPRRSNGLRPGSRVLVEVRSHKNPWSVVFRRKPHAVSTV